MMQSELTGYLAALFFALIPVEFLLWIRDRFALTSRFVSNSTVYNSVATFGKK